MMNLNRTGKRMGALSWVLILAFLLTSLGQVNGVVLAQDEVPTETPAVTEETPMPEVSQTPAIPVEPTDGGVSAQSDLPNLTIVTPDTWEAPLIFSSRIQTHTYNTMLVGDEVYLDFAVYNNGADINSVFDISVIFDGNVLMTFSVDHLASGAFYKVEDWNYLPDLNPTPGIHTIELYADSAWLDGVGFISESDESDNTWSRELTWYSPDDPERPSDAPANDLITNAVELFLDTPFQEDTFGSTISAEAAGAELADPINVCNQNDTESVWFQFTALSSGIYEINVAGTDYLPNISILNVVSDTQRDPVVCGDTNSWADTSKLSFMAIENETYLIGISTPDINYGRNLQLIVSKLTCDSNSLCGTAVNGDGSVIHYPNMKVYRSNGYYLTYGNGDYNGFVSANVSSDLSGNYDVTTSGKNSIISNQDITGPGYYLASAVGYLKSFISAKDTSGVEMAADGFDVRSSDNPQLQGQLAGSVIGSPAEFYAPSSTYNIEAVTDHLHIYQSGFSNSASQQFILNAENLAQSVISIDLDGISDSEVYCTNPNNNGWGVFFGTDGEFTYAAPEGTFLPGCQIQYDFYDTNTNRWTYESPLGAGPLEIATGTDYAFQVGGPLTVVPAVLEQPIFVEDGNARVDAGIKDAYNNPVDYIWGYPDGASSQTSVRPIYTVSDLNDSVVFNGTATGSLTSSLFTFPSDSQTGTWTIEETIDLGPLGGLQTASATFTVDSITNHPVVNDDFDSATVIESMPYSLEEFNTRGSTTAMDDPWVWPEASTYWGNSVWFQYTATQSGILTLDTIGQDYGTFLSVWRGSRGALSNVSANDNYYDPDTDEYEPYSQVSFPVTAGQTYYIMVQGFVGFGSEGYGKLNLHGSLAANPNCYSLSVSSNSTTYGTVQVLTVPNCGTQYSEGTKVLLSAVAKPGYGFYNWSDSNTDDPYTLTINANTTLKANFVKMVAPVITVPSAGALINDASPSFTWGDTQYADTYQIQIDSQSSFTLPIDQDETVDALTYESPALSPDGVKYYRVRAINAYGDAGPWSAVRSFTLDTLPPASPTLTVPADSAWIVGVPTYTWSAAAGANAYRFEYDTDEDFAHAIASAVLSSTSYKPLEQTPGTYYWRVWARDAAGNWSISPSMVKTVTVLAAVPPTPKITSFSTGPLTKSSTPTIDWGAVYFADTYALQISSSATFATLLVNETVDADTLSYVFSAPNDGDFYARVQAKNAFGQTSPWSVIYKFTVDTVAPAVPTLLSPIGESYTGTTIPKLTLAAISTANTYEYQVDDAPTFETPVLSVSSSSTGYSTTAAQALPLGLLYWRARAVDAAGNPSDWSAPQSFYQTNQRTPNTTTVVTVATPTFTWSTLAGATGYRLLVCQNEEMTECVIDATLGNVTKYVSPNPFSPAVYYWQIKVVGGVFDGKSTLPIQFSVSPVIPAAPKPSYPANGAFVSDKTPGLSWASVLNAANYEIQVNRSFTFKGDGLDLTTAESWIEATSLTDGKYYWRVRAIDANGAFSIWSSVYSFTIDTLKPNAPSLLSPGTDDVLSNQLPKLTVTKVIDATLYEYQASASPDFSFVILDKTINSTSYTLVSGQQLPLGKIYWRARVLDAAINASDWSEVDSFWVTNQKTPADESFTTSAQPQFTWTTVPNGAYYFLKVCKDPDLSTCVLEVNYLSVTGYKPTTPVDLGKYYWQIKVQSIDGIELMTSPTLSFTVTSPSLAAPVLLGPAVNLITKDTTVETSWLSVAEAANYEIQISQNGLFTSLVDSSVQPGTSYTSVSLPDGRYYWRVRTLNSYEAPGSWSVVRYFTVDTQPVAVPVLVSPLQRMLVNTLTPKLTAITVSGAKSYQFQVFPTDSPDDVWVEATVNTPAYTLTAAQALKFGRFSWRARTIDAAGNESDWSQPVSFIVTLQKSPLPASYTKVANTTFTWAAFPGATGFRVKICEDEAMETGCRSSADLTAATLKYILPTPLPDGIYYWQIEVLGTALENPFTPVLSFTKVH